MGWILRTKDDLNNPTLPGGVYGKFITAGRAVYYRFDGTRTRGIIFLCDGGKYGIHELSSFEYKGVLLAEGVDWILHRGTLTKQIEPLAVTAVDDTANDFTVTAHPFATDDPVRVGVIDGSVPAPLELETVYYAIDNGANSLKFSLTPGGAAIDLTNEGTGDMLVWAADAGFDDPDQGLPTFCPEVETTFSNIAYVEFKLPTNRSHATDQPDWEDFRAVGIGRRLMDYDNTGAELGVSTDADLLCNVALQIADNAFNNLKIKKTPRWDWTSWDALKTDSDVEIWQRIPVTDDDAAPEGFVGRYYDGENFETLLLTRMDATVDFDFVATPVPGVPADHISVEWNARIKPEFSEVYTIKVEVDDKAWVYINGVLLIERLSLGTSTAPYTFVADTLYDITVRFSQIVGPSEISLKWSSASQAEEVIPADRAFPVDEPVRRYENHSAHPVPVEASEVHERLMDRVPGWDWTDDSGLIRFLPPNRPVAFTFAFDKVDNDSRPNFVKNTLVKKRRPMADRKNFRLFRFRNVGFTGYPFAFVQADREELRRFTNGEPSNDPADDLGVATRSLAERVSEMVMVLNTDPDHTLNLSGGRQSSALRKNQFIVVSYIDDGSNAVVSGKYLVTFHSWGSKNEKNDFALLPIPDVYYTDEPVET